MGRSLDWHRTRYERAQRVLLDYEHPNINAVFAALRQLSDEPYNQPIARELARVLGCLPAGALCQLVDKAFDLLEREVQQERERATQFIKEQVEQGAFANDPDRKWSAPVAEIRDERKDRYVDLTRLAVVCDALAMAIAPPDEPTQLVAH